MAAFEHIMILLSFVYALALTQILSCAAGLIRDAERVRFSWFHAFWMLNALVMIVANWISFWDMRALPNYSIGTIVFTVSMAIANYVQAALVCPRIPDTGTIDLVEYEAVQGQRYKVAFVVSVVGALIANVVYGGLYGVMEWSTQNIAVIPMLLGAVLITVSRAQWAQIMGVVIVTACWAYYFIDLQGALR